MKTEPELNMEELPTDVKVEDTSIFHTVDYIKTEPETVEVECDLTFEEELIDFAPNRSSNDPVRKYPRAKPGSSHKEQKQYVWKPEIANVVPFTGKPRPTIVGGVPLLPGLRLVDLRHFITQIQLRTHDSIQGCNFENMVFVKEFYKDNIPAIQMKCSVCSKVTDFQYTETAVTAHH